MPTDEDRLVVIGEISSALLVEADEYESLVEAAPNLLYPQTAEYVTAEVEARLMFVSWFGTYIKEIEKRMKEDE